MTLEIAVYIVHLGLWMLINMEINWVLGKNQEGTIHILSGKYCEKTNLYFII